MAKKKRSKAGKSPKKRSKPAVVSPMEKDLQYMVQIYDPKMVRKDILESLREVIIFMQGYEKFRRIQEEKVALFNRLKMDVKELNSLITVKLAGKLPKGKITPKMAKVEKPQKIQIAEEPVKLDIPKEKEEPMFRPDDDLDQLESQLSEIESQLSKMN